MDQVFSQKNKTLKKYWKNGKKYWKSQGILSVPKSVNPTIMLDHFATTVIMRTQTLKSTTQEYLYDSTVAA